MSTLRHWDSHDDDSSRKTPRIILFEEIGLHVEREYSDRLVFDCSRSEVGKRLHTADVAEAAAAFLRSPFLMSSRRLWTLGLKEVDTAAITPHHALYWLSGGDREWQTGAHYAVQWDEACDTISDAMGDRLFASLQGCKTMGELRTALMANFTLLEFYELMLENKWVRCATNT